MNTERRGRPKEQLPQEALRVFTREYKDEDGVKNIWKYDLDKWDHGPVEVEIIYPKDWKSSLDLKKIADKQAKKMAKKLDGKVAKSKMKYLNPSNGKMVSYSRAKTLGIIN
jgi:hypothetical protein